MRPAPRSEDELVAALHEVGNALTVVLGWLAEARRNLPADDSSHATRVAIELCEKRSRRAASLCRRTIGAEPLIESGEPLGEVIREVALATQPARNERSIHLEDQVSAAAAGAEVQHVSDLISVLTNLLFNAIEAIAIESPERTIEIVGDVAPQRVVIRVIDSGAGVDESVRGRLFSHGATTKLTGAGVGLVHSSSLAARRGGSLQLLESKPGRTVFELTWPAVDGAPGRQEMVDSAGRTKRVSAVEETPHTLRKLDLRGVSIAIVDDDPGVVELLEMVLAARGARVCSFPRYEPFANALALSKEPFQVVLLDASPLGDALGKTLQGLRNEHRDLDLVLISGASDPGATLGKLGVTWIRKPFDIEEVVFVIQTLKRGDSHS